MNINLDERRVLTLDAGGSNFVFSFMQKGKAISGKIRKDANGHDLEKCLATLKAGFHEVVDSINQQPVAISFAFPGSADYHNGTIGDLNNLTAFRGGVPLKALLELRICTCRL